MTTPTVKPNPWQNVAPLYTCCWCHKPAGPGPHECGKKVAA